MPAKNKPPTPVPLLDIHQALSVITATVDTAVQALMDEDSGNAHVAMTLEHHVSRPIGEQSARLVQYLVKPKRRNKRAPNGSRVGKKRQRNRWEDRQKAKRPWER